MATRIVVGAQWGDEGKGKMVDYLAQNADLIVRYQGGDNAGHTVVNDKGVFKLHLIPCGIFYDRCAALAGTGMVVNPDELLKEIADVESKGVDSSKLFISERATMLMPYYDGRAFRAQQKRNRHHKARYRSRLCGQGETHCFAYGRPEKSRLRKRSSGKRVALNQPRAQSIRRRGG